MKSLLAIVCVAMVCVVSDRQEARAQGVHFGGGGIHVDVGRPHGGYGHRSSYGGSGHGYGYGQGYRMGWGGHQGHSDFHDTSHYDVHPGGYQRHYNHFDYVPTHYDYHRQGHFDYHH
jgi:hypothetical protein